MQILRHSQQPAMDGIRYGIKRNIEATSRYAQEKNSADLHRLIRSVRATTPEQLRGLTMMATVAKNFQILSPCEQEELMQRAGFTDPQKISEVNRAISLVHKAWSKADEAKSELEQAQDLMYEAWEATDRERRIELAKMAAAINADCIDAYVLLAHESTSDLKEARHLLEQAVKIGDQLLPSAESEEYNWWSELETRPYMRARAALALLLWEDGENTTAIDHLQTLVQLNPNDNQGVRNQLLPWLILEKRYEAAADLLSQFEGEPGAARSFTKALLEYVVHGATSAATALLDSAIGFNLDIAPFILGMKELPAVMPATIAHGGEDEAIEYLVLAGQLWEQTPGALNWLRETQVIVSTRRRHHSYKQWKNAMETAERYLDEGRFGKAKQQLQYALRQYERFGETEELCKTLRMLLISYLNSDAGVTSADEMLFNRALLLSEQLLGAEHLDTCLNYYYLGNFYDQVNQPHNALIKLEHAKSIAEKTGDSEDVQQILISLKSVYKSLGNHEKARAIAEEIRSLSLKDWDDDSGLDDGDDDLRVLSAACVRKAM